MDPPRLINGRSPEANDLREKALVLNASSTLSQGVFKNSPPRAFCRGKGHRVEEPVQAAPLLFDLLGNPGDVGVLRDVHLKDLDRFGKAPGAHLGESQTLAEAGEDDLCPLLLSQLGGGESDALLGQNPGNQ